MKISEINGWIGSQMLAFCGLPMVVDVITKGHADGYSNLFLWMWFTGEVMMLHYVSHMTKRHWPLLLNYTLNILIIGIVLYYKVR